MCDMTFIWSDADIIVVTPTNSGGLYTHSHVRNNWALPACTITWARKVFSSRFASPFWVAHSTHRMGSAESIVVSDGKESNECVSPHYAEDSVSCDLER